MGRNFTTVTNVANMGSLLCWSTANDLMMYVGLLIGIIGGRKRDAVESLIMKIGSDAGFGKGFLSGCLMNWRSVINIVGPLIVGSVYSYGKKRSQAGLWCLLLAC